MAQKIEEYKQCLDKCLKDETKPWTPLFDMAEEKTGVNRSYIAMGNYNYLLKALDNLRIDY